MFKSLLHHSFRVLKRQKGYLFINVIGLSTGIACSLIIALFIFHELSFDRFNEKGDRIYRLQVSGIIGERELSYGITAAPVGPAMQREIPEVESFVRIKSFESPVIRYQDKKYTEYDFIEADSSFFSIFSIRLLKGNPLTALREPHTVVLSVSAAKKVFGTEDAIDRLFLVDSDPVSFRVTGIMEDFPETSHFNANIIGSFVTDPASKANYWGDSNYATYVILKKHASAAAVNGKMMALIKKYMGDMAKQAVGISIDEFVSKFKYRITLQPLFEVHMTPSVIQITSTKPASNPKYIYIFSSIALLILVIAAINFMNLSTAQAIKRAREVGIKKVSGSSRATLIRQFMAESVVLSLVSLVVSVVVIENVLPYLNNLLGIRLQTNLFGNWYMLPSLLIVSLLTGLLAGSYPAFFLSSFNPSLVLKSKTTGRSGHGLLRSALVVLQFAISIVLIAGTLIMVRQIRYMTHKDLGFNREQLLVISHADILGDHVRSFKQAVSGIPDVVKVSASTDVPGHSESGRTYAIEGRPGDVMDFRINYVDYDFFDTYGIRLDSGRLFNESFGNERSTSIINESAVTQLHLKDPFNTRLYDNFTNVSVIGVVKDFHYESLQTRINPYIFEFKGDSNNYGYVSVRLAATATEKTIGKIEKTWNEYVNGDPFQYFFMDQDFASKYKEERQNARLSVIFSILAILIASMGLFGLTSFTIEQRTKEIGIRKTMGASSIGIFFNMSKEFAILVILATAISWPVIYYAAGNWLQHYYYRITIRPFDFASGFFLSLLIALATISYRIMKSARMNPVEALRYE